MEEKYVSVQKLINYMYDKQEQKLTYQELINFQTENVKKQKTAYWKQHPVDKNRFTCSGQDGCGCDIILQIGFLRPDDFGRKYCPFCGAEMIIEKNF